MIGVDNSEKTVVGSIAIALGVFVFRTGYRVTGVVMLCFGGFMCLSASLQAGKYRRHIDEQAKIRCEKIQSKISDWQHAPPVSWKEVADAFHPTPVSLELYDLFRCANGLKRGEIVVWNLDEMIANNLGWKEASAVNGISEVFYIGEVGRSSKLAYCKMAWKSTLILVAASGAVEVLGGSLVDYVGNSGN